MNLRFRRSHKFILFAALLMLLAGAASLPAFMRFTSTVEFCAGCHVMLDQHEDWFYSGMHRQIACVDCHLPHDNAVRHFVWKGYDGMKDVFYFYTGLVPEMIHSTAHARKTIQANCERCHEGMVSRIDTGDGMRCWECHRSLYHNRTSEF